MELLEDPGNVEIATIHISFLFITIGHTRNVQLYLVTNPCNPNSKLKI